MALVMVQRHDSRATMVIAWAHCQPQMYSVELQPVQVHAKSSDELCTRWLQPKRLVLCICCAAMRAGWRVRLTTINCCATR